MRIDISVLKKYDRPGPRYTSYPTAPVFHPGFGPKDFREEIRKSNQSASGDISLYFHIPFCDTLCYFCGCTMLVTRDRARIDEYISYLKKEIDLIAPMIHPERRVTQVHWGGGSPTSLSPEQILDISSYVAAKFNITSDVEMGVEVDPRELTQKHLGVLKHVGFNRISIGIQDFDPAVQKAVNRMQPEEITLQVMKWAQALEFESINVDLMYGLPFQSLSSFGETLAKVLAMHPNRLAIFNYAHVPWLKPHQKLIHWEDLPSPEEKLRMLKFIVEYLTSHRYVYIGMDHFAREEDELSVAQRNRTLQRNFQGYSTHAGVDVYGFGMSSISQLHDVYAQNNKTLPEYYSALHEGSLATHVGYRLTADDQLRRHVIMNLMCNLELNKREVEERFNINFDRTFSSALTALDEFVADGLVVLSPTSIKITDAGRMVIRPVAMCFDAHLKTLSTEKPIFSRTV